VKEKAMNHHITRTSGLVAALAAASLLGACASPPKPPQASESTRQPANDPAHIEALKLQGELQRARVELALASRQVASQRMLGEAQAMARPMALRTGGAIPVMDTAAKGTNIIFTVRFPVGSTKLALSPQAQQTLIDTAKSGAMVVLRGRTDAVRDNPADVRIARQRAEAAQLVLARAGIAPNRIRVTWQGAGDTVASNDTAEGRAMNRRVEIEVYAAQPEASVLEQPLAHSAVASN
jgi:outer membrane protein OmpA-like peptidoglycan-associated protein